MIKALPENVWTRIAAGEVVERPASAVKELVENSLDAGATQIRVSLSDGGRQRIIVQDNGSGIAFDELPLALMYHATSKISEVADLENIMTLGYRGEALASIASVADVEIRSRQKNSDSGGLIRTHDGKITEHLEINCNIGTRIQVDNLFSALPARRKFLKSAVGELRRAAVFLREYAVCNPDIAFTLEHDNKQIFSTEGTGDKKRVLSKIWSDSTDIQNTNIQSGHLNLECWFQSKAGIASGRSDIIAFVNGRAVNDPVIKSAVTQGARELSGNWALFFTLEPSLVDVNIHPAKSEIRFRYPAEIYIAVKSAVNNLGSPMKPEAFAPHNVPKIQIKSQSHKSLRQPANYSRQEPVKPVMPEQQELFLEDFDANNEPEINYIG
ncbi:MAG: DNA mismatch repair endonuclease MutL, partial [Synergistaceae bacterium]|nr:DNA mismatch repair endonuclease MutL [Synergistaceae bacterium]